MSQVITLELQQDVYAALSQQAESLGISLSEWIEIVLKQQSNTFKPSKTETEKELARQQFRRHAGAIDLGYPTGTNNSAIDADLVRAYSGEIT